MSRREQAGFWRERIRGLGWLLLLSAGVGLVGAVIAFTVLVAMR